MKALDQEARSALRKHGVRFGQFTIFLPLLLKPAPTRLRLVLWSLANGLQEFPESPPPGLVTIPNVAEVCRRSLYARRLSSGRRSRAIRIDMLERLADLLRAKDSRAGFEATPDMLSITGMTLDQFADLMAGLGYRGEKAERPKHRAEPVAAAVVPAEGDGVPPDGAVAAPEGDTPEAPAVNEATGAEPAAEQDTAPVTADTADVVAEAAPDVPAAAGMADAVAEVAPDAPVETEVFYTFTWAPRPRGGEARGNRGRTEGRGRGRSRPRARRRGRSARSAMSPAGQARRWRAAQGRPARRVQGQAEAQGRQARGDRGDRPRDSQPKTYEARPPREQKIDPDNPFAVLAALKTRS